MYSYFNIIIYLFEMLASKTEMLTKALICLQIFRFSLSSVYVMLSIL